MASEMSRLHVIQTEVHTRTDAITAAHPLWPCCKGCDDCCRSLASVPRVSSDEWQLIHSAINNLPAHSADSARRRIRESAASSKRPIVCPLLDTVTGACLVYAARPIACRAYGFYAEREHVLGCRRIETLAAQSPDVIWGNHSALEDRLLSLGPARELFEWLH